MRVTLVLSILGGFIAAPAASQTPQTIPSTVNVFLDCQAPSCDSDHFRSEIEFVNWVRDRTVADVHLLITSQGSAGGGTAYQLNYIGLRAFAGDSVTLPLNVPQTATDAERRDLLTQRIAQGLVHYAARTAIADRITLELGPERGQRTTRTPADDPWKAWVFSAGIDFSTSGESRELSREVDLSFEASRVTRDWKLEFEVEGSYEEDRFELTNRTASRVTRDYNTELLIARAIAPLWSVGAVLELGRSTFRNQDFYSRTAAGIEYSFFPYEQFSRRRITLLYSVGARYFDYNELTIYERFWEQRFDHQLELSLSYQQPWGEAFTSFTGSHYLHNAKRSNLSVHGGIDVRLFRGFSLDVFGAYARVRDQLYLARGDDDDEDVLLRRRALETNYEYDMSVGIRYTFGSIYNNIVNPRIRR